MSRNIEPQKCLTTIDSAEEQLIRRVINDGRCSLPLSVQKELADLLEKSTKAKYEVAKQNKVAVSSVLLGMPVLGGVQ